MVTPPGSQRFGLLSKTRMLASEGGHCTNTKEGWKLLHLEPGMQSKILKLTGPKLFKSVFFYRGGRARLHPSIHPQYNDFLFFLNSRCNLHHCTLVGNLTRIAQTLATIWWIQVCHLSRSSFLTPWAINFSDPFCEAHQSFTRRRASNPRCERISTAERR